MMSKNIILIAIFVAACFRNNSCQNDDPYANLKCENDLEFKKATLGAPRGIVIIIVTNQPDSEINESIINHFPQNKTIQVNVNQGGDCSRTVNFLEVDTINNITSVRMMKDNFLVPDVLVTGYDINGLNDGLKIASAMVTHAARFSLKVSNQIANWNIEQPMPGTRPQAAPPRLPVEMPSGSQAAPRIFPFAMPSGSQAAPRIFPFAMPSGPVAGQTVGSSMTPSQRASYDFAYQQQSVQRVNDSSSLPRAPASGSHTPSSGQQSGGTSLRTDALGTYNSSWLTLGTPRDESLGAESNAPTSEQPRRPTSDYLKPVTKIQKDTRRGAGTSRGPR